LIKPQIVEGDYAAIVAAHSTALHLGCIAFIRRSKDGINHELHLIGVTKPTQKIT